MSYVKILSVINEHTVSTVTARYAIAMAAASGAELLLYTAHEEGSNATILDKTGRQVEHVNTVAARLHIPVTLITETGKISKLLPDRVAAEKADLVFYPITPYRRYGADPQRHAVHCLLRTVKADLAVMRAVSLAKPHPGHILAPLGRNIGNLERRLLFISELSRSLQAKVTLFHLFAEGEEKVLPDDITLILQQLKEQHVPVLVRSGRGEIGKAITVEAIARHYDLLILGASERGLLRSFFLGSPAVDIMHLPPCNTILFRGAP